MKKKHFVAAIGIFSALFLCSFKPSQYEIAVLKYRGGGDWYANPTALTNLIEFCSNELSIDLNKSYQTVEAGSQDLFNYPFVHMTGHGNVEWNNQERENLRNWLNAGGFLHIDDNYGMDKYVRIQLQQLFPNNELREIAADHPIFHQPFDLPEGLPKVHEHDGGSPQAFGIFIEGRLAVFYSFESDLGDGWEDPEVHNDPAPLRQKALKMGANLISYAFNGAVYVQNH
ncbi:MAG: DUF4159 domain-containing protein [Bacteroidetes bacterium]|uniref:DUF4159 domain-containing protein n=1 Tax=Phaeocystidibacter marisrubri TaxID=1577780 RepID=A0A6L3ZLE6_9FLAO|nr:DUF4159 domain-containing protein [Phaeocystidibacter marisrubri]KAB2817960.1 DUF4159 domain-containing protein [Phaeocystidibacter marisrubri]TNE28892.1 MAG: DUF4159 domain-containing protein [Bacteroidota bacterium]GGH72663.1 hypothetical protein GCM10011318_16850 [Phaeocystidibacter marisrubri]